MPPRDETGRVSRSLRQFAPEMPTASLVVEAIGEGAQAAVSRVASAAGGPIYRTHPRLVVKLYKPAAHDAAPDEFASLDRLHAVLHGRSLGGWHVHTPSPLFLGDRPRVLVMTEVPGRPLNALLREPEGLSPGDLASVAAAVALGLGRYWRDDRRVYGDIDLNNVLCDPLTRALSFVDPGAPGPEFLCDGLPRDWFPASRDLANMLFEVAVSVRPDLGRPAVRRRQIDLVGRVLGEVAHGVGSPDEAGRLLDEVLTCAHARLAGLRTGRTPAGVWRSLLKRWAARTLAETAGGLRASLRNGPGVAAALRATRGEVHA